jgi:hypothetical protein
VEENIPGFLPYWSFGWCPYCPRTKPGRGVPCSMPRGSKGEVPSRREGTQRVQAVLHTGMEGLQSRPKGHCSLRILLWRLFAFAAGHAPRQPHCTIPGPWGGARRCVCGSLTPRRTLLKKGDSMVVSITLAYTIAAVACAQRLAQSGHAGAEVNSCPRVGP